MRVRCRFAKTGKIRWTSHRDLARMWERAFRRTDLPLAYSVGFSPRPKVSFGLALSTGHESVAEYLDLELDPRRLDGLDVDALPGRLSAALPDGVDVAVAAVIDDRAGSLQQEVASCRYEITVGGASVATLEDAVGALLAADSRVITRERKGVAVTDDVRPAVISVAVLGQVDPGDGEGGDDRTCVLLAAEVATQPRGLRPAELLIALRPSLDEVRVRRTHQWIWRADGARVEPLALPHVAVAVAPPAAEFERVS